MFLFNWGSKITQSPYFSLKNWYICFSFSPSLIFLSTINLILEANSDSESEFASSIKLIVDRKINEGLKEKQIYQFLREKYGDWVIFDPLLNKNTYVLWLLPLLLFLFGGTIILKRLNNQK